jgi:hypothetical protein
LGYANAKVSTYLSISVLNARYSNVIMKPVLVQDAINHIHQIKKIILLANVLDVEEP